MYKMIKFCPIKSPPRYDKTSKIFQNYQFLSIRSPPRYDWESRLASLQVNIINAINIILGQNHQDLKYDHDLKSSRL